MPPVEVVRTYLEMASPAELRTPPDLPAGVTLAGERCGVEQYRFLYGEVGREYHWRDRLAWSDEQLAGHLARPELSVWVLRRDTEPLGFFELLRHPDDSVEIAYFGLLPGAIGLGLGRVLLAAAVQAAWAAGAVRVWLHTCTLDHPAALSNYLARGFRITRTERYLVESPPT